jgi:hypothetical protein
MKACLIFNNAHAMDFILHCKPCMHACIQGNEGINQNSLHFQVSSHCSLPCWKTKKKPRCEMTTEIYWVVLHSITHKTAITIHRMRSSPSRIPEISALCFYSVELLPGSLSIPKCFHVVRFLSIYKKGDVPLGLEVQRNSGTLYYINLLFWVNTFWRTAKKIVK